MKRIFTKLFSLALLLGAFQSMAFSQVVSCFTLQEVAFPENLVVNDDQLIFASLIDELSPDNLIANYGFTEEQVYPMWEDLEECESIGVAYEDILFNINDESFKIIRTWTVIDWETEDIREGYQIIKNLVSLESQSFCGDEITLSVSPWTCSTTVNPEAFLQSGFNYENVSMNPPADTEFDLGVHNVTITAVLGGDIITCNNTLFVVDNSPPVIITQTGIQIDLGPNCSDIVIYPETLDNGSHDGDCGEVTLSIEPSSFDSSDAGTTVTVYLYGEDESGNINYSWAEVEILPCGTESFDCINLTTVAGLNENSVELHPEDFLTSTTTHSGDLSLTITDSNGNVITDGILPQGSGGGFDYTVTDNVTGESCSGIIQAPLAFEPCSILACFATVTATLSSDGNISFTAQDFTLETEDCTDLSVEIFDENSNSLTQGTSVQMDQAGSYVYQVSNSEENLCWGNLEINEFEPCPNTISCNNMIFVSMYAPQGSTSPVALITTDMLLEGNVSGCDVDNYLIEISDTGVVGYYFEGTGSVEVNQAGLYNYTITNSAGNSCWGMLQIENFLSCPGLTDIVFPEDLNLNIVGLVSTNLFEVLAPQSLIDNYGFSIEETMPTWDQTAGCDNLIYTYADQLFNINESTVKVLRTWSVLDWLTGEVSSHTQVIENIINPGLICDYLPNSAEFGDCGSGHTDTDDVEWPDDLSIADYRIKPADLVTYSQIAIEDAQPELVNNIEIYSLDYIDVLNQLQVNLIKVNRVWTIAANGVDVASYTQEINVDITGFSSLVAVNTLTQRPVPGVALSDSEFTNDTGVGFPSNNENVEPSLQDNYLNGLSIKDLVLIQHHILGLRNLRDLQLLVADLNNDNSVSAIDLVELSKAILEVNPLPFSDWFFIENSTSENIISPNTEYIALKPGDVDDDADLGTPLVYETGSLLIEDHLINNGESYATKLQYDGQDLSFGVEAHLYYDPSLITINQLQSVIPNTLLNYNNETPGEIHFTLTSTNGLGFIFSNENYITIDFSANNNGLLSQAIDETTGRNSYLLGIDYELIALDLEFVDEIQTGTKDVSEHASIFTVYPNPVTDAINFEFENNAQSDYNINLFNLNGQLISTHKNESSVDVSALSSGMYFYLLVQDGQSYSGRFQVIR